MENEILGATTNGLPIYSYDAVKRQRELFYAKKVQDYIAQQGGQENALKVDADIIIAGGNRGGGKANSYSTPVIVPSGTVLMGELKVGDPVCTPYEGTQTVEAIFEQGVQQCYRFYFDDGSSSLVMDNHRFVARHSKNEQFQVYTARQIMDRYRIGMEYPNGLRRGTVNLTEIPLCGEIGFREQLSEFDLPIHPYVLGALTANGQLYMKEREAFVPGFCPGSMWRIRNLGFEWIYRGGQKNFIRGYTKEQKKAIHPGHAKWANYRIPKEYMLASVSARRAYLQGVMDIGGTTWKGVFSVTCSNKKFLEDLAWIARSLGIWALVKKSLEPEMHCLQLKAYDDSDLFYSDVRKVWGRVRGEKATSELRDGVMTKKVIHIKKSDSKVPCRCIQVSGKDHLYLTDGFTVNHNTVMLLMNPAYNINNANFDGIVFRKEKDDLTNIVRESERLYGQMGEYNRSAALMQWKFRTGAQLKLSYYTGTLDDFEHRMQGRQYAYIGVDEITQMEWDKFKYLITTNRNAFNIRNRFLGTCNPDPSSWVRVFIDWWIGKDGYPIPERDGVVRYCFMGGDSPEEITWGSTRKEVYLKAKNKIDSLVSDNDPDTPENMYVKSVVFVRAELDDNRALLESSPEYKANLAQQSDEKRERDFKGNWDYMSLGDDLVKMEHLRRCFNNPQILGDKTRWITCDVAFDGGDNCVMWLWVGWHVQDVFVTQVDSESTINAIRTKLEEWRVLEENLIYDLQGIGQSVKGFFKKARPFNNQEATDAKYKGMYGNKKDQCMKMFADRLIRSEISFEPSILSRHFSGKNFKNKELREILMEERKVLCQDMSRSDYGWCNIRKEQMKRIIGRSPDFIESLMMREIVELKNGSAEIPSWLARRNPHANFRVRSFS